VLLFSLSVFCRSEFYFERCYLTDLMLFGIGFAYRHERESISCFYEYFCLGSYRGVISIVLPFLISCLTRFSFSHLNGAFKIGLKLKSAGNTVVSLELPFLRKKFGEPS
jgi:hypothetical protein